MVGGQFVKKGGGFREVVQFESPFNCCQSGSDPPGLGRLVEDDGASAFGQIGGRGLNLLKVNVFVPLAGADEDPSQGITELASTSRRLKLTNHNMTRAWMKIHPM